MLIKVVTGGFCGNVVVENVYNQLMCVNVGWLMSLRIYLTKLPKSVYLKRLEA